MCTDEIMLQHFQDFVIFFKNKIVIISLKKISDQLVIEEFWNLVACSSSEEVTVYQSQKLDDISGFPTKDSKNLFPEDIVSIYC